MDNLDTGTPATETPLPDTSAPLPAVEGAELPSIAKVDASPAGPKDRGAVLREAMQASKDGTLRGRHAINQPRQAGKFAGPPIVPAGAQQPVAGQPLAPAASQRPAMPKSLRKELEPLWNAAPAELVQAFIQRDQDAEKGITQYKSQAEQASALLNEFKPYEWILRNENATPVTAIAPLLKTAALLRTGTPAQKAQAVAQTMQQFGIPIEHIAAMFGGKAPQGQSQAALDPAYSALYNEVNGLKHQFQTTLQSQQQNEEQRLKAIINQFSSDPTNSHFESVKDKVAQLLQAPALLGPNAHLMGERELLELAYKTAIKLDPTLSAQLAAQQQAEAQRIAREKAQQAVNQSRGAAVQVRGAPGAPSTPNIDANDRRSVIANAVRSMGQS